MIQPVSPLDLKRYELKYRIPFSMVEPISRRVAQYCELDYYSEISPDGFYIINSLYLDTPGCFFLRKRQSGERFYSSFRVRSYGADPYPPFYVESKEKVHGFCIKRRGRIPFENIEDVIERPWSIQEFDPYSQKNIAAFIEKVHTYGLEPKILTQYRRKAYLSVHDDYARVTFDRDMRYMEESRYNVHPDESRMTHYDHAGTFDDPYSGRNVVLELKCERKIPYWMAQLVRDFQLTRHSFSKYKLSMAECLGGDTAAFAFDRQTG